MTTPWQPTGDDIIKSIVQGSARRRADCRSFLDEFFEMYADGHTSDEFDQNWVRIVKEYPWYADDVLHCLAAAVSGKLGSVLDLMLVAQFWEEQPPVGAEEWAHDRLNQLLARLSKVFEDLST